MPEGPEVETIRLGLLSAVGCKIKNVYFSGHKKYNSMRNDFAKLANAKIISIDRKGKLLIWQFGVNNSRFFAINSLGMTGIWKKCSGSNSQVYLNAKHAKFGFSVNNFYLIFIDTRVFGNFIFLDSYLAVENYPYIRKLGPDILSSDFDVTEFIKRVRGKRKQYSSKEIGKMLIDPAILAGCGNIYKSESLFIAGIHPQTPASQLNNNQLKKIAKALLSVAKLALESGGSSLKDFESVDGYRGLMQNKFDVYDRVNEPCTACSTLIRQVRQGGRNSFFCPRCQPGASPL